MQKTIRFDLPGETRTYDVTAPAARFVEMAARDNYYTARRDLALIWEGAAQYATLREETTIRLCDVRAAYWMCPTQ